MEKTFFSENLNVQDLDFQELSLINGGNLWTTIKLAAKVYAAVTVDPLENFIAGVKSSFGDGFTQMTKNNPLN